MNQREEFFVSQKDVLERGLSCETKFNVRDSEIWACTKLNR
jgi:hypothetical protein